VARPDIEIYDELPFRHIPLSGPEGDTIPATQGADNGGVQHTAPDPAPVNTPPQPIYPPEPEQEPETQPAEPLQHPPADVVAPPRPTVKAPKGVISSTELQKMNFTLFGFDGEWQNHLGKVMIPFSMMVHGKPGSGKSTYCIKMANHCAANMGKNVLYVGNEEGFGPTMKEKFDRLNAYHDNLHLTGEMPDEIDKNYDIIFLDSVHTLGIGPEEMDELIETLHDQKTAIVFIFHSTKDGTYRGATTNEHLIDISTKIESGLASTPKNRYGGTQKMYVFEE
jgi:predicted ATP-dependent serine protease